MSRRIALLLVVALFAAGCAQSQSPRRVCADQIAARICAGLFARVTAAEPDTARAAIGVADVAWAPGSEAAAGSGWLIAFAPWDESGVEMQLSRVAPAPLRVWVVRQSRGGWTVEPWTGPWPDHFVQLVIATMGARL